MRVDTEKKAEATESGAFEAQLTYQTEPGLGRTAACLYIRRTVGRPIIELILILIVSLVAYFMGYQNWLTFTSVISASAILVLLVFYWWWAGKTCVSPTGSDVTLGISEDSISFDSVGATISSSVSIKWTHFKEIWCHGSVWLLFFGKRGTFVIIPAALASEDFKKLLLEKATKAGVKIVAV